MKTNWEKFMDVLEAHARPVYEKYAKLRAEKLKWRKKQPWTNYLN